MRRKRHHRKTIDVNSTSSLDVQKSVTTSQINHIQLGEESIQSRKIVPQAKSSEEVHIEPKVVQSCFISTEETSNLYCPEAFQPLMINDSCELFLYCKEENLTPEQLKFHADEWMNYVKFTANINDLPHISAVKESDITDQPPKTVTSSELPVLLYSNSATSTQSLAPFVPSSGVSNTPIVLQVPPTVSSPLNVNNVPLTQCIKPPAVSKQPSIFPVKLERSVEKCTDKNVTEQSNQEEILPLVLQEDRSSPSLLHKVKDASPKVNILLPLNNTDNSNKQVLKNGMDSTPSPSQISDDSNDSCIPLELLCNIEVNVEEKDADSLRIDESTSNSFCSDIASDSSNGPKIIDVLSGDAGANEFFKDTLSNKVVENDSHLVKESGSSPDNFVYSTESSMPKTVTQFSIFSMQKTIAVISSGTAAANIHNLLGVRLHIPPIITDADYAAKLKNKLREDMFMTLSPWWMIQKRFLPLNPPCTSCGSKAFRLNSCFEFLDSLCWTCDNSACQKIYPVKRPKFFDRFPSFSLEELLLLTYHWACKSRIWVIAKDVPVHEERIWSYFCALQELCGKYVSKNCMIGKHGRHAITVEASAVKLGKFFILCAYDRKHKESRLQALTTEEACGSVKHIRVLQQWLGSQCTLITWKKINEDFLPGITKVAADPTIGNIQSSGRHILNASRYLGKTMVQLFQNICHEDLTVESVQGILDEVQWRERVGKTEESAFWNIMNEISRLNDPFHFTDAFLGEISKDRFFNKADLNFRLRWGPNNGGSITSSTLNLSDKDDEIQQIVQPVLNSAAATENQVLNSSTLSVPSTPKLGANEIEFSKKLHPIRVVGLAPPSHLPREKDTATAEELLSIRVTFSDVENIERKFQAFKLGLQLRKEGFLFHPIQWLVQNKYIKDEGSCYVCQGKSKLIENRKFPDGVSWLCQKTHCMFENRYKRPMFFAYFGFNMDVILATIFHWAVQSDYSTVVKSIPLNEFNIISIYRKLQRVCSEVSEREEFKIGGKKTLVEVAFVRFANCFILGAMERDSLLSRFRAFSIETKLHIDEIRKTLISWLHPGSTVIVNSNKYLGRYCMEERINLVFADKTITDVKCKRYHTLTIGRYLQSHIKRMFRNLRAQYLSADLLQVYMDELMWRERYRKTPRYVFQCIMRDIFSVEYGESYFLQTSIESMLKEAAAFYGITLPLPEVKIPLQRLPNHVINSYTSTDIDVDTDEITIIEDDVRKEIKIEIISDDDDEEIEVVNLTPNAEISPEASSSVCSQNDDTELYCVSEKSPVAGTSNSELLVNKSEDNRRYSDKCYSRKKREIDESTNLKLQCMECQDFVTVDHFVKPYRCSDCKYNVYSTYCQKAFARHRAFILFGKNMPESCQKTRFFLNQPWYCICGYSSLEGNELASHLIQCKKTTCYLNILKPSNIL